MKCALQFWRSRWLLMVVAALSGFVAPQKANAHGELLIRIAGATKRIAAATNNLAQLYLERGELYREDQKWEAAETDYATAEKLDPNLAGINFCRAQMLTDAGRFSESLALFNKYLALYPTDGEAFIGRARVRVKLNERKPAVEDFRRGLEMAREPEPEFFLELAQTLVAEDLVAEALRSLDDGIKRLGPIPTLQTCALDLELNRKNYPAALTRLETLMGPAQRKESWLARRGDILLLSGRPAEARKSFEASRAAIKTLPGRLQQSPSMLSLQARLNAALSSTNTPPITKTDKLE